MAEVDPAGKAHPSYSEFDQQQYEWFISNDVAPETAADLINKYKSGAELDAWSGSDPSAVATTEIEGWVVTRAEYADGSVYVSRLELPSAQESTAGGVSPMGAGSCTSTSSGSGWIQYYNCAVVGSNNAWLSIEFRANYLRSSNGTGTISSVSSPYAHAVGGSATTPTLKTLLKTGSPAHATATTQFSGPPPIGSRTCVLHLYVNGTSAWTTNENF